MHPRDPLIVLTPATPQVGFGTVVVVTLQNQYIIVSKSEVYNVVLSSLKRG